jgi:hypothetical protein
MVNTVRLFLASVVGCALVISSSYAQQKMTLGDLLDRGGRKLAAEEVKALFAGTTVTGVQGGNFPDVTFENVFAADGSVTGNAWKSGTWFSKIKGKWSIDRSGQLCTDLLNDRQEKIGTCQAYYALGSDYYTARGDARSSEVNQRKFKR